MSYIVDTEMEWIRRAGDGDLSPSRLSGYRRVFQSLADEAHPDVVEEVGRRVRERIKAGDPPATNVVRNWSIQACRREDVDLRQTSGLAA